MSQITFSIPNESINVLAVPADQAGDELRMLAAVKLYELNRVSSGAAAKLAGIPKSVFLQRLGDYGVATFRQTEQELLEEIGNAQIRHAKI